jgi:hypothetical protein
MRAALEQTLVLLRGLEAPAPYTFGYPCGETRVGKPAGSYVLLVSELFLAARGVEAGVADPWCDPLDPCGATRAPDSPPQRDLDRELSQRREPRPRAASRVATSGPGLGGRADRSV